MKNDSVPGGSLYRFVDCQCFAGGFTLGMVQAGFELAGKREMKGGFGVANCEANRALLGDNWHSEAVDASEWTVPDGEVHVVAGNPPCSGFSVMSAKSFRGAGSKINSCMWAFAEYAARVKPEIAVFESVQLAAKEGEGRELMRALRDRLEELTNDRYTLYHVMHNAYSVGGSSQRRRYFWLASRIPFGIEAPGVVRYPVLNEVIGDLVDQELTWESQPYATSEASWWASDRRSPSGVVDGHMAPDTPVLRRIQELINRAGWNAREPLEVVLRRCYAQDGELPPLWRHNQDKLKAKDFFSGFTGPVRWDGERASRVITGGAIGSVIHPTLDRTITHREAARIMGFPDDWSINAIPKGGLAPTWGKGITVDCGKWIGKWIHHALDGDPGSHRGELVGDREYYIDVTNTWQTEGQFPTAPSKVNRTTRVKRSVPVSDAVCNDDNDCTMGGTVSDEVEATASAGNRRGRPRSADTVTRDENVLALLENGPLTKAEIMEKLTLTASEAYLSLFRLGRDERVTRVRENGKHVWYRNTTESAEVIAPEGDDVTAPAEAPAEG